jgi:hypothetical protein
MAATRNLFERPDLLDNQTRLILSADAKPKRLIRTGTRSAGHNALRERTDSGSSGMSMIEEVDHQIFNDTTNTHDEHVSSTKKISSKPEPVDYDTDIEQELESERNYSCETLYLDECRRHGVIPSTFFLRNINKDMLTIRYCGLKPINVKMMIPAMKMNSTITKLDLRNNGLGSRGAIYVAKILKENEYIDELNLGDNDIGTRGMN